MSGQSAPLRVSIVTPSFNQGRFIEETIQSVLGQAYPHIEYIVVDGGSTDDTHRVLDRYAHHIDHLIVEPDEGQVDAINKGFGLATGDLLGWINSDDLLAPQAVEAAVDCYRQRPEGTLFYGDVAVIDEHGNHLRDLRPARRLTYRRQVNGRGQVVQPGSLCPAELVRRVGGLRTHLYLVMDADLWLRLLQLGDGWHVGVRVGSFRQHGGAKSSQPPLRYLSESLWLNREFPPALLSRRTFQLLRLRWRCLVGSVRSYRIKRAPEAGEG